VTWRRPANFCPACGQDFGSVTGFDRHRVGRYDYPADDDHPDGRRCLTGEELLRLGMRPDRLGRWRLAPRGAPPWSSDVDAETDADAGGRAPHQTKTETSGHHIGRQRPGQPD
jgi:hypothetical protein